MTKQQIINEICEAISDCSVVPNHLTDSQKDGFLDLVEGSFNMEKFRKKLNEIIPEDKKYTVGDGYDR